jgi:hypothetical protein
LETVSIIPIFAVYALETSEKWPELGEKISQLLTSVLLSLQVVCKVGNRKFFLFAVHPQKKMGLGSHDKGSKSTLKQP